MSNNTFKGVCLMNARTTNGTDGYKPWNLGNQAILQIEGTMGTGSVTLHVQGAGGNDVPVRDDAGVFTATTTGTFPVLLVNGQDVKATLAAGSSTVTVHLLQR